jgi:hypothetical protein
LTWPGDFDFRKGNRFLALSNCYESFCFAHLQSKKILLPKWPRNESRSAIGKRNLQKQINWVDIDVAAIAGVILRQGIYHALFQGIWVASYTCLFIFVIVWDIEWEWSILCVFLKRENLSQWRNISCKSMSLLAFFHW